MGKTSLCNAGGVGLIPGQGAKIPHASWPKEQNMKQQKQNCNKFNKEFKKKKEEGITYATPGVKKGVHFPICSSTAESISK